MKDQIARERIEKLENEINQLKSERQFWDNTPPSRPVWFQPPIGYPLPIDAPRRLTAVEILKRFDELYEFLGIERTIEPQKTKLKLTREEKERRFEEMQAARANKAEAQL